MKKTLLLLKNYKTTSLIKITHLKDADEISITNYCSFHTFLQTMRELPVVSLILVNNNALRSHIPTHSNLQADVVNLSLHLFNINSPSSRLSLKILMILFLNYLLPTYCWGSKDINDKGGILETFINNHGLCLYNIIKPPPPYLQPATGSYTSIDTSICFPTLLLDYDLNVHGDLCESDHFQFF